jgi:hypothetical protein
MQKREDAVMVVATQGLGAEFLQGSAGAQPLQSQGPAMATYERLPEVLSSADIPTAVIEPDAGLVSVTSHNSQLPVRRPACGGRESADHLPARTIQKVRAGPVVEPGDESSFIAWLDRLLDDPALRQKWAPTAATMRMRIQYRRHRRLVLKLARA